MFNSNIKPLTLILGILLATAVIRPSSAQQKEKTFVGIGFSYAIPHFKIDHTVDMDGDAVHFFTSPRQSKDYLGFYFNGGVAVPLSKNFGRGARWAFAWWQADYILNWEMPEYALSLEPLESSFGGLYFDIGYYIYCQFGPFRFAPGLTMPIGFSSYNITIEDEVEGAMVMYTGLSFIFEANLFVSDDFALVVGYQNTSLIWYGKNYEVEEGVKLKSEFEEMPEMFYFGIAGNIE